MKVKTTTLYLLLSLAVAIIFIIYLTVKDKNLTIQLLEKDAVISKLMNENNELKNDIREEIRNKPFPLAGMEETR